jgi:hypothetical protein
MFNWRVYTSKNLIFFSGCITSFFAVETQKHQTSADIISHHRHQLISSSFTLNCCFICRLPVQLVSYWMLFTLINAGDRIRQSVQRLSSGWNTGVRFPAWSGNFLFTITYHQRVRTGSGVLQSLYPMGTEGRRYKHEAGTRPHLLPKYESVELCFHPRTSSWHGV